MQICSIHKSSIHNLTSRNQSKSIVNACISSLEANRLFLALISILSHRLKMNRNRMLQLANKSIRASPSAIPFYWPAISTSRIESKAPIFNLSICLASQFSGKVIIPLCEQRHSLSKFNWNGAPVARLLVSLQVHSNKHNRMAVLLFLTNLMIYLNKRWLMFALMEDDSGVLLPFFRGLEGVLTS